MEYSGKLYGKVGGEYFPLMETTEDVETLKKRIAELEAENEQLRIAHVVGRSEQLCPKCGSDNLELTNDNENLCNYCENVWA